MTLEQAKSLQPGRVLYHLRNRNADKTPQRWKVNGKVKTWKRDPSRIRIPIKHGMWSFDYITESELCLFEVSEALAYVGDNFHIPTRAPSDL